MDKGEMTGVVYIDLAKAFDTVSHSILLEKLDQYGISGTPNDWFASYLFGQYIQVNHNVLSDSEPVYCGVPQGSILGPLLFLIHFNGIHDCVNNSEIITYADDTVIFISNKNKSVIEKNLQKDLECMSR